MKRYAIVVLLLVGLPCLQIPAQAQGAKLPTDALIEQPVTLNGERPSIDLESATPNFVSAGVGFASFFDSNPGLTTADTHSDISHTLLTYLRANHLGSRLNWDIGIRALLIANQQLRQQNRAEEELDVGLDYLLSPHVGLRVGGEVGNSSGLFSAIKTGTSGSSMGLVEQPNNSLLIPSNQRAIRISSLVELTDQVSPRGVAGVRATYSLENYLDVAKDSQFGPLYNSRSYAGEVFYNRQFSDKQWGGVMLRTEEFKTQSEPGVRTDGALFLYALKTTGRTTLSLFAGLERLDGPQIYVRDRRWLPAAGATFVWQNASTGLLGEYSREVSVAGGLPFPEIEQSESIQLWRRLGSPRTLNFGFGYSQADLLSSQGHASGLSASARFDQQLTRKLTAEIGYTRDWERRYLVQGTAIDDLAWVSLSFGFSRPLGK